MTTHETYLRSSLAKYKHSDLTKRDILNAFKTFTDLRPKLDTFVFNDGSRNELLCLDGTVPVNYKGATYNIPVCLWIIETYPFNPPMVFVKPTNTMQIKAGKHVDTNGRVYLPYLHEWKHPQSDLLGLIEVLVIIFGEEPPVFARSASAAQHQVTAQPYNQMTRPPYPTSNTAMPTPVYPQQFPQQNNPYPAYNANGRPGYPQQSQPVGAAAAQPPYPTNNYTSPTTTATSTGSSVSLTDEQVRLSLLSAVEDKMKRRLRETFAQAQAEMDALQKTNADLQRGKHILDDMFTRLQREQTEVDTKITMLKEKNMEMKEALTKLEDREEVSIDDAVVPTAPIYKQILESFAEEQVTEDTIYYLQEGLKREVIDLEVFLKQVRELSRQQYKMRVLIQKCRQKAGLPDSGII